MIPIIMIFSFIFEGILTYILPQSLYLTTYCTLAALLIIYPYFRKDNFRYYMACALIGFFYDIIYTNTIILNAFIFVLIGFLITVIDNVISNNSINDILEMIFLIIIYQSINFFFLAMLDYTTFSLKIYLTSLIHPMLLTLLYTWLLYIITNYIGEKLKIKREI